MEAPQEFEYTPAFLEAFERFKARSEAEVRRAQEILDEDDPDALATIVSTIFREEMRNLGQVERIKNLYKIKDKLTQKFVPYRPNKSQLRVYEIQANKKAILKCRQVGYSTDACIRNLDRALFDEWPCGIMSHRKDHVSKLFDIVRNAYDLFKRDWGEYYQPKEAFNNANELAWSDTKASLSVAMDFQGRTVMSLHISEAHFIPTERIVNSLQAVPDTGEVTLETTPNGRGGYFFKIWQDWKKNGINAAYHGFFVPWQEHYPETPEKYIPPPNTQWTSEELALKRLYNLEDYHLWWRRRIIVEKCDNDESFFDTHYPTDDETCWLAGSFKVFKKDVLLRQSKFVREPGALGNIVIDGKKIKFEDDTDGFWRIYDFPKVNLTYSLGVDTSTGSGLDPAVICILCNESGEQVARYSGMVDTELLADEIFKGAQYYNRGYVNPEINNTGLAVMNVLVPKYSHIYRREEYDSPTKKYVKKFGFYTSSKTKSFIISNLKVALKEGTVKVRDQTTFDELTTFIHKVEKKPDGRLVLTAQQEAEVGCFDDEVIALALANEMRRSTPKEDEFESSEVAERREKGYKHVELDDHLL